MNGVRGYCKIRLILCNSLFYASSSLSVVIQMDRFFDKIEYLCYLLVK